jgi:hypothetical protein
MASSALHIRAADRPADKATDSPEHKYADGPLTPADYRRKPPDEPPVVSYYPMRAMTYVGIRYTSEYRWDEKRRGDVEARLIAINVFANVDRSQSWIRAPGDLRLLDHEQGHFDIAEANARRAQAKIDAMIKANQLVGHGRDERSARADLDRRLKARMDEVFDDDAKAQKEYDRVTDHGRAHAAQAEQRRLQKEALEPAKP